MGIVQNIIGMVRDIHDRQQNSQIGDAEKNYLTNPDAAIAAVNQIDAPTAIALQRQHVADQAAALDAKQKAGNYTLSTVRNMLRGLPEGTDYGAAFDNMAPAVQAMGIDPTQANTFRAAVVANPSLLMDDKAYENWSKDQYSSTVATPGSHVLRAGKVIDNVPFAIRPVTTPGGGATTNVFDPNTGHFATPQSPASPTNAPPYPPGATTASPTALTVDALRPIIKAQESHGDYTAVNKDTGALGAYQVMPAEGQAKARALGLAWRPDMMSKNDPASVRYQDAIGGARIQDSVDASGGDPAKLFSHYYSGSPTAYQNPQGNPKTATYVHDMMGRLGGVTPSGGEGTLAPGSPPIVTPTSVTTAPKPVKPAITYRDATPQELKAAGYPAGSAAQIDGNGKMVNLKVPSAASTKQAPSYEKYGEADSGLGDLERNILALRDDPKLATTGTGLVGGLASYIPGTHRQYLQGLVDTINSQKMISLLSSLQASGGNPFSRVTNVEATMLPKTLGNFALNQSPEDLKTNLNHALQQVHDIRSRVRDAALHAGVIDQNGNRVDNYSPASAAPAQPSVPNGPVRARDARGVLHQLMPGQDPSNPASWRTVQ